jgi:cytoskeletal protein RodZ
MDLARKAEQMKEETSVLGLSTIRLNRGISLEQIAESTKISVRLLQAIERGEFRKLPGGIYSTSYIRQYARAIEYDESAILELYRVEMARIDATAAPGSGNGSGVYGGLRAPSTILGS